MGKIIVFHIHPGLLEKISSHTNDNGIEETILERLTLGISHSKIGAEIALKWNFPEVLIAAIKYHHIPLLAPDAAKDVVSLVYLANYLTKINSNDFSFSSIEVELLNKFRINDEMVFKNLGKKLELIYQEQKLKEFAENIY